MLARHMARTQHAMVAKNGDDAEFPGQLAGSVTKVELSEAIHAPLNRPATREHTVVADAFPSPVLSTRAGMSQTVRWAAPPETK